MNTATAQANHKALTALNNLSLVKAQNDRVDGFYSVKWQGGHFNVNRRERRYWIKDRKERMANMQKALRYTI